MSNLQEAFREAARREFAMVPEESELDHVFSLRFERKMRRIIRAQVHGYWMMVNTAAKRVAVAVAIIIMLLTTAMAIKPIRERVIKFFIEVYEDYFEIHFGTNTTDDIAPASTDMARYTLTLLPEGYNEIEFISSDTALWTYWQNSYGQIISLHQDAGAQEIVMDNTGMLPHIIQHEQLEIKYQRTTNMDTFIWSEYDYIFHLTVYEEFTDAQILQLIDSLDIANNLNE